MDVLSERIKLKLKVSLRETLNKSQLMAKISEIFAKLPTQPEFCGIAGRYTQLLAHYFNELNELSLKEEEFVNGVVRVALKKGNIVFLFFC